MTTGTAAIEIIVNGEKRELPAGTPLLHLVDLLGLKPELIAVEINRELVRRADLAARTLGDGDRVEIVEFVGGG